MYLPNTLFRIIGEAGAYIPPRAFLSMVRMYDLL